MIAGLCLPAQGRAQVQGVGGLRCNRKQRLQLLFRPVDVAGEEACHRQVVEQDVMVSQGASRAQVKWQRAARVVAAAVDLADGPQGLAILSGNRDRVCRYLPSLIAPAEHDQVIGLLHQQREFSRDGLDSRVDEAKGRFGIFHRKPGFAGEKQDFRIARMRSQQRIADLHCVRGPSLPQHLECLCKRLLAR